MSITPQMVLEIRQWEMELPKKLTKNSKAYVLGHKVAIEMIRTGDASFEFGLLSRLVKQHAYLMAYREYVERIIDESGLPQTYDEWLKTEGDYLTERRDV